MKDVVPQKPGSSDEGRTGRSTVRATIIVLAVATLLSGFYFAGKSGTDPQAYSNDFNVYYHAAGEVIAGRDPYQHSLGDWTPYIYPPLLAELMVPLALLPLPVAAYLWFLVSAASLAGAAWMSARLAWKSRELEATAVTRHIDGSTWYVGVAAVAVVVVLRFVLDTFNLGQVNAVVAGLAVAHVYLYARGKKTLSAVALTIAFSIKLTPALLLIYHLAKLRLKFALSCLALLVAVNALSFLVFGANGVEAFRAFAGRTLKNEQGYDFAYSGNQSVRGAIARLTDGANKESSPDAAESRKPADPTALVISIVILLLAVLNSVRGKNELESVAPFFCCMVLLSPLSWKAHYVMLILPVVHLVSHLQTSARARSLITAILAASFALFNLTSPRVIGLAAAEWADTHSLVLAGALLIFSACLATKSLRPEAAQRTPL